MASSSQLPSSRRPAAAAALAVLIATSGAAGCFDSDEIVKATTDEPDDTTTITDFPSWSTTAHDLPEEPDTSDSTCEDALDCISGCAGEIANQPDPFEPDLSCFLECEEGLSVDEALLLLHLLECVSLRCDEQGLCDPSDLETSSDQDENECLDCIVAMSLDPQPPGCLEEALACD